MQDKVHSQIQSQVQRHSIVRESKIREVNQTRADSNISELNVAGPQEGLADHQTAENKKFP